MTLAGKGFLSIVEGRGETLFSSLTSNTREEGVGVVEEIAGRRELGLIGLDEFGLIASQRDDLLGENAAFLIGVVGCRKLEAQWRIRLSCRRRNIKFISQRSEFLEPSIQSIEPTAK